MIRLDQLFDIRYGHSLELNRLKLSNPLSGIPFISRKMGDNGVAAYVDRVPGVTPNPGGELTCALSGNGVLSTFIQDMPYYTAFHVACLAPRQKLSRAELLYYCTCIAANRYKYSWGRQANRTIKSLMVPDISDIPNWVHTANIDMYSGAATPMTNEKPEFLEVSGWKPFMFSELFDIKKGKRLTKANMIDGGTPFIGSTDSNNGVTATIGQQPNHRNNTITVAYNGSVAEAFYQPVPFCATDDVNVLYPKFKLTPAIALFLITLIKREKYRFNYGRKWHMERMNTSIILLPAKSDETPDWDFMERYIQSLPFSTQIE